MGIKSWRAQDFWQPSKLALGLPILLYNGYWVSFPGVKSQGHGDDHQPPPYAEVIEEVELYLYFPPWLSLPAIG